MAPDIGTRSFRRSKAMSLSKLVRLNLLGIALITKRVSGRDVELQRLCSPNVIFIMNHMKLERKTTKLKIGKSIRGSTALGLIYTYPSLKKKPHTLLNASFNETLFLSFTFSNVKCDYKKLSISGDNTGHHYYPRYLMHC